MLQEVGYVVSVMRGKPLKRTFAKHGPFLAVRWFICGLLSAVLALCCPALLAEELGFFHHLVLSTEDGLPQASVHALMQSRDGYLWVGTEGGVARFDGQAFRVFNRASSHCFTQDDVSSLAEDSDGDIWVGTSDGLVRLRGETCTRYAVQQGLPSSTIISLARDAKRLLAFTSAGEACWQGDRFYKCGSQAAFRELSTSDGAPLSASDPWSFEQTAVHLRTKTGLKTWRVGADLPGSRIQTLYVDAKGTAWVGTNRGLAWLGVSAAGSQVAHQVEDLKGESVLSVLRDREGDIWIGTEASGLQALQPRAFATEPGSEQQSISAVVRDSDSWMSFGTRADGVFRVHHGSKAVAAGKLTSPVILSLAAGPHGELWVGTPDGLNEVADGRVRQWTIANGLPDNFVRTITVTSDGSVWAGTRFGLVRLQRGKTRTYTQADGLLSDSIGALQEVVTANGRAGTLWVGTAGGVCRLQRDVFQCLRSAVAGSTVVTALGSDGEGRLWVALHGQGLALVESDQVVPVRGNALPQDIAGIEAAWDGSLWLRSSRGLFRVPHAELQACVRDRRMCAAMHAQHYGRADGMQSEELTSSASPVLATSAEGQLWVATRRGVAVTDAAHLASERVAPGLVITSARIDGNELPLHEDVQLSPDHRQYSVQYAGLALNNPGRTRYRYMLEGLDRDWVDAGTRQTAYYTKLPAGPYVFRVQCVNGEGVWSKVATLRFVVLKPWYRRGWAYLLGGWLLVLAVFVLVRGRVLAERRRLTVVLQERTRVAREVHDTVAQDLVSVSLQLELTAQHAKAGRVAETNRELMQAKTLVKQALDSARQSIWELRANLNKGSLPSQVTARVEQMREKGIVVRLRIGGEYRDASAAMEAEILRVASEAMANIEKHAGTAEASVELLYLPSTVRLVVRDDGCGFDMASARALAGHYGLKGMEERAGMLAGNLTVESEPGQGTTVTLEAPFPAKE